MDNEYDGLAAKGFRIQVDIDPTGLFQVSEAYTHDQALELPSKVLEVVAPLIPEGWVATAKVKAKVA